MMEGVLLRFPLLGQEIFEALDDVNLTNSRKMGKSWKIFIDNQKFYWIRVIKMYCKESEDFLKDALRQINVASVRNIAQSAKTFYKISFKSYLLSHENWMASMSSLHYAAMSGEMQAFTKLFHSVEDINPKGKDTTISK